MAESTHKSLAEALAAFQGEVPTFKKSKTAKVKMKTGGEYTYTYADLGDILPVVGPLMAKHGLSWSSKPGRDEQGEWMLRYVLRHVSGERDADEMSLCVDKRCKPQELGSAITYMRRYAQGAQLGLATEGDDDGQTAQGSERSSHANGNGSTPRTTAQQGERSEAAATAPQKGMINVRFAAGHTTEGEAKAILQWKCGTGILDRVAKRSASELIDALKEDGSGAVSILTEIIGSADTGDGRAVQIVERYLTEATA